MERVDQRTPSDAPAVPAEAPGGPAGPEAPRPRRRRRRRWPWIAGVLVLIIVAGAALLLLSTNRAREVTIGQAEQQLQGKGGGGAAGLRPAPGVYEYRGSGSEHLSLPPLSQAEGPTMPGTVTLRGDHCWVFRIDYSTHHWQTWDYCRHGAETWETGGRSWQLWTIGPLNESNTSDFTCAPRTMSLPATAVSGQQWQGRCVGTNTAVAGKTLSAGPYRFIGLRTLSVGGTPVRVAEFLRTRTDSGAQKGHERSEVWLDATTGLPIRLRQDISVRTDTPFGASTYTQSGMFTLVSLQVHR